MTIAAGAVAVGGLLAHPAPAPNSTAIIFLNNTTPKPQPAPAGASPTPTPRLSAAPGTVRDGAVVVDVPNPAAFSAPGPRAAEPGPVEPAGALNQIGAGWWLALWPALLLIALVAVARLTPKLVLRPAGRR